MSFNAEQMLKLSESVSLNFESEIARAKTCIETAANTGARTVKLGFDDCRAADAVSDYLAARGFVVEGWMLTRPRIKITW